MRSPGRMIVFALAMLGVFLLAMAAGKALQGGSTDKASKAAYELVLPDTGFTAGKHELSFRIEQGGKPVTSYKTVHEKKLHLIAVREDFRGFQHLHPTMSTDGTWTTQVRFEPGQWHVYADFTPSDGKPQVLTGPISAEGVYVSVTPDDGPQESSDAFVDGYAVDLHGSLDGDKLTPTITRNGKAITPEPYLGAQGHLVAIRHESFDYLHVHPSGSTYMVEVDQPGTYELFLQFKAAGKVHTAQFTLKATGSTEGSGHDHDH